MLAIMSAPLAAQTGPDRMVEQYQGWTLTCAKPQAEEAALECAMEQTVNDSQSGAVVLRMVIRSGQTTPDPVATLIGPFGVDLAQGLSVSVDGGTPETLAFRTCLSGGCIATLPLDAARLEAFRAGQTLTTVIRPVDDPSVTMSLPISLAGFTAALERLQASTAAP